MARQHFPTGIKPDGAGLRIRLWQHGKLVHSETLKGDSTSASLLTAAKNRRKWLESRLALGLPLVEGETESVLFEDVAQGYLNTLDAKHSSHISYENILNYYWMPVFGGWPISDITTRRIKEVLATFKVATKTKRNVLSPLRGVLDHGEVNPNPCNPVKFKRRKGKGGSPVSYTPEQRNALMSALDKVFMPDWLQGQAQAYFALLFGAGLRPCGEPLALQWSDYDGTFVQISKQITKRKLQPYTKTDVVRRVYVPTSVRPYLDKLPSRFEAGYIFKNSKGGPFLDSDHMNDVWRAAHIKARIPYQEPYACRHTRASELLSTGVQVPDAAKQLGHSIEMFLQIYASWVEEFAGDLDLNRLEGKPMEPSRKLG
jgi:integrase